MNRAGNILADMIKQGSLDKVAQIISATEFPIDWPIKNGMTALMVAASEGTKDVLIAIAQRDDDVNRVDCSGRAALHYAT